MPDAYQQAHDILSELAAATPREQDGPGVLVCPRCLNSTFMVTPGGRVLCDDDDCYELFGYAVISTGTCEDRK